MVERVIQTTFSIPDNAETIDRAITVTRTQAELARQLQRAAGVKCYPQKINEWRIRGVIPPYWVKHVAAILDVPPHEVDPLLYD